MTTGNLLDVEPEELDREQLINVLGRIDVYRYKLNELSTDVMHEMEARENA